MSTLNLLRTGFALALTALSAASVPAAQVDNTTRVSRWNEDLDFFTAVVHGRPVAGGPGLPGQKHLQRLYPRIDRQLAELREELPALNDGAISWRLARIWSSAHVAHNSIVPGDSMVLVIGLRWLPDGPVIAYATPEYRALLGVSVEKVGGLDSAQLLERMSPYLAYETEGWQRVQAEMVFARRALLRELQLVQDDKVVLTVATPWGSREVEIPFGPASTTRQIGIGDALSLPVALTASHPGQSYYWQQHLPGSAALYIQYNRCANDPALAFVDFAAQVARDIDTLQPRRVIVDLRFNGGGDTRVIKPLLKVLAARSSRIGRPVVLIGEYTFSSGVRAARDLRSRTGALLVGSATGGLNGGYGEAPATRLPNSGLGVQWSLKKYSLGPGKPVMPDVEVAVSAADLLSGRDAVLETALALAGGSR